MPSRSARRSYRWVTRVGNLERRAVRLLGEHERVRAQLHAERGGAGLAAAAVLAQRLDRFAVERQAAALVGLQLGFLPSPSLPLRIAWRSQIDSRPSSRLTADQRIAQISPRRAPVVIATHNCVPQSGSRPRLGQDPGGLVRGWRVWVLLRRRGRLGLVDRTHGHPAPADGLLVGAGQDEVDVPDGRCAEGTAPVLAAAVVAVVRLVRAVVDGLRRRAVLPAPAELGVEGVQRLRLQVADRDLPEVGRDVVAHVAAVERAACWARRRTGRGSGRAAGRPSRDVRGLRRSATSTRSRSRIRSAFFHAFGPGSTTSRSMWRFPVTGSTPA